jgi:cobalt-zinc-cadmium efflux system outer membrane protein
MKLWLALACCAVVVAFAQQPERKFITLHGTVEAVNPDVKQISVANEAVPGGMGAMTMKYSVDKDGDLSRLKPGERITAKMYEGETKLFDIVVEPAQTPSSSSSSEGMRLEELEQIALANNPTAAQADANFRAAFSLVRQSGLYPNPTVGYYGDEIRGGSYNGGKQGGFINQTIVTAGKLQASRRVAAISAGQSKTNADLQRVRILTNVRIAFYQVLVGQRLLELRGSLAKLADDAARTGRQLANIGQAERPDVLQAEVEHQQASVSLRIAQQNLAASWRTLAAVAGKPELPVTHLAGDLEAFPDLNYEQWLATTWQESPEVKLAQQAVERAEASLVQARKQPIPNLELSANLTQDNEPLDSPRRPVGLVGGVQVGVQIPIFNHNQGNIAAARDEVESTRQELARRKLQIARDLAAMFRDYDAARTTVQQYKTEVLPRAEEAHQLYLDNYQKMTGAYPRVLVSQRTLFQLEAEYVQALEMVWHSSLGLRGFGLMDGLSMPMR